MPFFTMIFVAIHQLFQITGLYSKLLLKKDSTGRCHVNKKLLNWGMFRTDFYCQIAGDNYRNLGSESLRLLRFRFDAQHLG